MLFGKEENLSPVLSSGSVYRVPEVEWWVLLIPATMANPAEMIGGWPNDTNETVVRFSNKEVKKSNL
jgi:hypothetical protein